MSNEARFDRLSASRTPFAETPDAYRLAGNWYGPWGVAAVGTPTNIPGDFLIAVPFLAARGGQLNAIGIGVTVAVADVIRLGIYRSNPLTLYPTTLVVDSGDISVTPAGFKSVTVNVALAPGDVYWLTYLADNGVTPTVNTGTPLWPLFGFAAVTAQDILQSWLASFSYNALPATFPAGGAFNNFRPLVVVRFSNVGQA